MYFKILLVILFSFVALQDYENQEYCIDNFPLDKEKSNGIGDVAKYGWALSKDFCKTRRITKDNAVCCYIEIKMSSNFRARGCIEVPQVDYWNIKEFMSELQSGSYYNYKVYEKYELLKGANIKHIECQNGSFLRIGLLFLFALLL